MSENNERKRELTRLRVKKHRAIRRELRDEWHDSHDERDLSSQNVNKPNEYILPGGRPIVDVTPTEDLGRQMDIDGVSDDEQLSEVSNNYDSCTGNEDDVDGITQLSADSNDCSTDTTLLDVRSESSSSHNREDIHEQYNNEVEELREWAIRSNIRHVDLDSLLQILRKRVLPELPQSSRTFLGTTMAKYNITEMEDCGGKSGQFVYLGIAQGLHKFVNKDLHKTGSRLQIQVNVDGMPMAKSSFSQVWPILCKVFHTPDVYQPFPVAIYCGASKPKCMNSYLGQFIVEYNVLGHEGIMIDGKEFKVSIHSFICDTPSRSMLKCVKGHTGFYACERCNVEGMKVNGTTVFPSIDSEERTDETFRRKDHPEHHSSGTSPLLQLKPPIDMVKTFVLDHMHLFFQGVMKRLLMYWVAGKLPFRLSYNQRAKLSSRLELLKTFVTCEFQRKPRAVKYISKWKATELRFFLLYCGPVVLKGILKGELYNHFLLLHVACRILCSPELALKRNAYAKIYLKSFFLTLIQYYGQASQVMNAHNLIHVPDDAINMRCDLSRISCFPFENVLGSVIKKCIRTHNRPLAQICRRLHEQESIHQKVVSPPSVKVIELGGDNRFEAQKIKFQGYTLCTKAPDNKVMLKTGEIVRIESMHCAADDATNITITGSVWGIKSSIFKYPCDSKHLKLWELTKKPSLTKLTCNVNCIQNKAIMLPLPQVKSHNGEIIRYREKFIMPLLHL